MRKKIILRLALFSVLAFTVYSCVHDDFTPSQQEKQPTASSFKVFQKDNNGQDPDYTRSFAFLYEQYKRMNPDFSEQIKSKRNEEGVLAFFRVSSQSFTLENGNVAVLYPVLKYDKVAGLAAALWDKEKDEVSFHSVSEETEGYTTILNAFALKMQDRNRNLPARKGEEECTDPVYGCEIEKITITPPRSIGINAPGGIKDPWGDPWNNPPAGDCGFFGNCTGTGGTYTPPQQTDPCKKMKTQNSTQEFKDKIAELDKKEVFDKKEETGFAAAYGPKVNYEPLANAANDNLKFPPGNKYFGYIHTHLDSKEGVVKIFSPADVTTFLTSCVGNAKEKGTMTDAYGMVITSQGNYILKYSGDGNFAITNGQYESWQTWYNTEFAKIANENGTFSQDKVEKLFTQFLIEKVKINGLELYKSEKTTGKTNKLEYNGKNNPVKPIPCP